MAKLVRAVCATCGEPVVERGRRGYVHRDYGPYDLMTPAERRKLCPEGLDWKKIPIRMETLQDAL